MSTEQYSKIKDTKNLYITADGCVLKKINDYEVSLVKTHNLNGYQYVNMTFSDGSQGHRTVHSLVAEYFLQKPKYARNLEIDHINGIKTDNRIENLRYISHTENMKNGWKNGQFSKVAKAIRKKRKQLKGKATRLTAEDVKQIRRLRANGLNNKELAFIYDLHRMQISRIVNYRSFANII